LKKKTPGKSRLFEKVSLAELTVGCDDAEVA